jgi:DNA-binding transcriptional ArsR family regulator
MTNAVSESAHAGWTLITNHGAVLIHVAGQPRHTVREIAAAVGITERSAARILRDLRDEGYIACRKEGRRNVYELNAAQRLRHPVGEQYQVRDLLSGLVEMDRIGVRTRSRSRVRAS